MKVRQLDITRFRGVLSGRVVFNGHGLLVGGNNVGKSTVCEALDVLLGPDRLYRRPVIDEHDFYQNQYLDGDGDPLEVRLHVVLIDLSEEVTRRFGEHIRRWDDAVCKFVDDAPGGADRSDSEGVVWALPIVFIGRYDAEEDDFIGETFFDHPEPVADDLDDDARTSLGEGRQVFSRAHKRLCGFIYLRALRTGSRALSLQRGSLLDTILRLPEEGSTQMWLDSLAALKGLDPAIGDVKQLKAIRTEMRSRLARFVNMAPGDESATFFASDLTREHLREVVKLFVATQPSDHLVPYARQGTGSVNLIVFALLTMIADLKGSRSVIFAMEEPEIALPPHTQRRVTRFVLQEMGQAIVTSHSPYVIEQFEPENAVILERSGAGTLNGRPIDTASVKPKSYRTERRQFAEAILARAVLVCEGSTEATVMSAASSALERVRKSAYEHLDLAGVSLFTAHGDGDVPRYGPIFAGLGKKAYAVFDKQSKPLPSEATAKLSSYDSYWESPEFGLEDLLVKQTPMSILRSFLEAVSQRVDYPFAGRSYTPGMADDEVSQLALDVLKARKGEAWGYAAMVFDHCQKEEDVSEFIRTVLDAIDTELREDTDPAVPPVVSPPEEPEPDDGGKASS